MPRTEVLSSLATEKPPPPNRSPPARVALEGLILRGIDLLIPGAPAKSVELTLEKAAFYTEDYPCYTAQ